MNEIIDIQYLAKKLMPKTIELFPEQSTEVHERISRVVVESVIECLLEACPDVRGLIKGEQH
jgi:hypothetical protein